MSRNVASDQRRGMRRAVEARQRRRIRPTVAELEDRRLLSMFTVNNPTDTPITGEIDLRQAIGLANSAGGGNTINFDSTVFGTPQTITLTCGQLELSNGTETITGPSAGVTISGNGQSRIFQVDDGVTVCLNSLTLIDGNGVADNSGSTSSYDGDGGAILNLGTLSVNNVTLSGNSASVSGGGIYTSGGLMVTGVTFDSNTAEGSGPYGVPAIGGGAIDCIDGTLAVTGCTFTNNQAPQAAGGAVQISNQFSTGSPTIASSTFTDNAAAGGGAIEDVFTNLTILACNFTGDNASLFGGAINNGTAVANVSNCTFTDNTSPLGGAINSYTPSAGSLNVSASTITGNSSTDAGGGGIWSFGTLAVTNSTLSSNSAQSGSGGAIYSEGTLTLTGSTLSSNTSDTWGGGLSCDTGSSATIVGCTFESDSAAYSGGAFQNIGTATVIGGAFLNNTASQNSGAIDNVGLLSIAGTLFQGNSCASFGGAISSYGFDASSGHPGTMQVDGCTFENNTSEYNAGGVFIDVTTGAFSNCTFEGNSAPDGGGILSNGAVTITGGEFLNNTASGNSGAIDNSGTLSVSGTLFQGNSAVNNGGAISTTGVDAQFPGTMQLDNCNFDSNTAGSLGGGVFINNTTATITGGSISSNAANGNGGGISSYNSTVTITGSTFESNSAPYGGGICHVYSTVTIRASTFEGNSAWYGGGLYSAFDTVTITDCTFESDSASYGGGGVFSYYSTATLTNCTVSGNSAGTGGGLSNYGTTSLGNTIVAGNTAASGPDISGYVASQGNNLIGKTDGSSGWVGSDLTGTIASPLNPLLAPLGNYGGPTQTMALLPGSPAIDAGNNNLIPAGVTTDQRGLPRIVNNVVDIGAFESSGFTIAVTSGSGQSTPILTAFSNPLVVTVTANNPAEPVAGGLVTFTTPASGASATISGSPATISAIGTATATTAANGVAGSYTVTASASGITTPASFNLTNESLIVALDPSASGALSLAGNASIKTSGVVYVDSSSPSALSASGNAQVKASAIDVHGKVQKSGNASLSPAPVTGAAVLAVASLPLPSTSGMTNYGSFSLGGNSAKTIQPGIYSSISVSGNAKLTMASGIYIIEGGGFSLSGNASVTGSGVMIVNAGSKYPVTGGTYGSITLSGNGACNLSPATSGTYAGIVFFQTPDNTKAISVSCNAAGISGTIYAPGASLSESGNGTLDASLVVDTISISGNGVANILTTPSSSVETAAVVDQASPNASVATIPITMTIRVNDALGNSVSASSLPVVSMSPSGYAGTMVPQTAEGSLNPGDLHTFDTPTGTLQFNLKTKGYTPGL